MMNHCGTCTACCRVFAIPELQKPAGQWCGHCAIGKGCKVYDQRPATCVAYECLWLQSQSRTDSERLPLELRPDRCKVVLSPTTNPKIMGATTMPGAPDAWQRGALHRFLQNLVLNGFGIAIGQPRAPTQLKWTREGIREVRMTPPDKDGMQWSIDE